MCLFEVSSLLAAFARCFAERETHHSARVCRTVHYPAGILSLTHSLSPLLALVPHFPSLPLSLSLLPQHLFHILFSSSLPHFFTLPCKQQQQEEAKSVRLEESNALKHLGAIRKINKHAEGRKGKQTITTKLLAVVVWPPSLGRRTTASSCSRRRGHCSKPERD